MLQLLISLFIFEITVANQETNALKYLEYGYNDGAKITINISNIKRPFIFGLATKNELKYVDYYTRRDKYSDIQYNITKNFLTTIEIKSKVVLTPYSIPLIYGQSNISYFLQIDIDNVKNHHDSRCGAALICTFVFSVLFTVILIGSNVYFLIYQRTKYMFYFFFDLLVIAIIIESVFALLSFNSFNENEFLLIFINKYSGSNKSEVFMYQFAALLLSSIQLLLVTVINLILYQKSPYRLSIFDYFFVQLIYFFLNLGLLVAVAYYQYKQTESFVYSTAFYFFFVFVFYFISNRASLSSIAIALLIFVKFLTFSVKYTGIILSMNTEGINSLFFSLNYVNLAFQFVSIVLFLVGVILLKDLDKEPDDDENDDDNNNNNDDVTNEQFVNSIIYKPESARLFFDENESRNEEIKRNNNATQPNNDENENENNYSSFLYQ